SASFSHFENDSQRSDSQRRGDMLLLLWGKHRRPGPGSSGQSLLVVGPEGLGVRLCWQGRPAGGHLLLVLLTLATRGGRSSSMRLPPHQPQEGKLIGAAISPGVR